MNKPDTKRRSSGRITLSDVAKAAGVSPITASRALRGERGVAPELADRVRAAVQQLGYVPDPAARALASQRSVQVPVLVPLLSAAVLVLVLRTKVARAPETFPANQNEAGTTRDAARGWTFLVQFSRRRCDFGTTGFDIGPRRSFACFPIMTL